MNWLLPWLNTSADRSTVTNIAFAFHNQFNPMLLIAIAVTLVVAMLLGYRHRDDGLQRWQRTLLISVRTLFLLCLLLIFVRPLLLLTMEGSSRQTLLLLCDTSASMGIRDIGSTSRLERAQSLLRDPKVNLLHQLERDYDLRPFVFGRTLAVAIGTNNTDWVTRLHPSDNTTAIGDAVRDALASTHGDSSVAGIVLLTDGGNNIGMPPLNAAMLAREENVPLFIYGIGNTQPKDIVVTGLFAPELAIINDEISVNIHLRGLGLSGRSAPITLTLGEQIVAQQTVTFSNNAEQVVTMKFTPKTKGRFDLTATITPLPDELVQVNNICSRKLRVSDSKIKVLFIEQSPRWEFQYLLATLLRDRQLDLKCVLMEGDPGIAQGENTPYLKQFPSRKEDLFAYDLIILGDVDPKKLTPNQLDNLSRFVAEFGGGLMLIAGQHFMPEAYRDTMFSKLFPVELDSGNPIDRDDKPIPLELTGNGRSNPMMRLTNDERDNVLCWRDLPPIYWVYPVGSAKPGAETLLVTGGDRKMPVLVTQQYGAGHVLFLGTDNTWRWRKNFGELYFTTFWNQAIHQMALQRSPLSQKRIQISLNRQTANLGEPITCYARVYTAEYEPLKDVKLRAFYANRTDAASPVVVQLRAIPEQSGMFCGEFLPNETGAFKFLLERDPEIKIDFDVTEPQLEFIDVAMNDGLLRQMATLSGGQFLADTQMPHLAEIIGRKSDRITSTREIELWSTPLYFALLLGIVTVEWILRKLWQLK